MNWTEDQVYELIDVFKENRMLWDKQDAFYGNNKARADAWVTMHQKLGFHSKEEIKRKMMNLLTVFKREKKKRRKIITNANGQQEVAYDSGWYAFERMSFLLPIQSKPVWNSGMRCGVLTVNEDYEEIQDECSKLNGCSENDDEDSNLEFAALANDDEEYTISTEITPLTNKIKRKISTETEEYSSQNTNSEDPLTSRHAKDDNTVSSSSALSVECTAFGNYVASKLQNYPKRTKNVIQYHINNIFFKADLGLYDCVDKKQFKKQRLNSDVNSQI